MSVSPCRVLVPFAVASLLASAARAQTYLGPTPYLSRADSPLKLTKPTLDDLEDGSLNILGVTADNGAVIGPGGLTDSVDADDGTIDGSGTNGHSFFYAAGNPGITFTFDDSLIGGFPTSAGVVWTDGGGDTWFEAFDVNGASLGQYGPFQIADGSNSGTTGEDRFFGVAYRQGVSAIHLWNTGGGIECYHVQYSFGALSLEANDRSLSPNDPIDLTVAGGKAGAPAMVVAVGANGIPLFLPVLTSTFDGSGELALSTTTPSGLAGLVLDLVGLGIVNSGKPKFSNAVELTFN